VIRSCEVRRVRAYSQRLRMTDKEWQRRLKSLESAVAIDPEEVRKNRAAIESARKDPPLDAVRSLTDYLWDYFRYSNWRVQPSSRITGGAVPRATMED
jgi:hypothetical protein